MTGSWPLVLSAYLTISDICFVALLPHSLSRPLWDRRLLSGFASCQNTGQPMTHVTITVAVWVNATYCSGQWEILMYVRIFKSLLWFTVLVARARHPSPCLKAWFLCYGTPNLLVL
jgi:hypothetical protein